MLGHAITLFTSGNQAKMKWIQWGDVPAFVAIVRDRIGKREMASTDAADQIRKLAQLRDDGILSEEEFQEKKRQLLGL